MVKDEEVREAARSAKNPNDFYKNLMALGVLVAELKVTGDQWKARLLIPRGKKGRERELAYMRGEWLQCL